MMWGRGAGRGGAVLLRVYVYVYRGYGRCRGWAVPCRAAVNRGVMSRWRRDETERERECVCVCGARDDERCVMGAYT